MNTITDPQTEELNLVSAINQTLREELQRDPQVRVMGYDIGPIGGVFRATEGLFDEFGDTQVIDTPLSENGLIGTAVGMAMRGERPVVEMQFLGFMYNAWGQFIYSLANLHQKTGGLVDIPVTIRATFGGGIKPLPFHSESTEAYLMHTPGIRVVCPSSPSEAKGLLAASIRCDDPVIFLEQPRNCISTTGRSPRMAIPTAVPIKPFSLNGVSITWVSPNSSKSPSVARNTPPIGPMS